MASLVQDPEGLLFEMHWLPVLVGVGILIIFEIIRDRVQRNQNREQLRNEVRVQLFQNAIAIVSELDDALGAVGSLLSKVKTDFSTQKDIPDNIFYQVAQSYASKEEISERWRQFSSKFIKFLGFLENHEVVLPQLKKFRTIIAHKENELSELYYRKVSPELG